MSLTIIEENSQVFGKQIKRATVVSMVQNFCDLTFKKKNPTASTLKIDINNDSHGIHYTKAEIDQLFNDNAGSFPDGVRIYLGLHQHNSQEDQDMPERPPSYIGQHTAIIVCTNNKVDILEVGNSVLVAGAALDEGEICPPPACGSIDNDLHP